MSYRYYITEVFSEAPFGGNQLATLVDAGELDGEEMQKIARAFNFAETTFITGGSFETGFDVRIFTPASELPFAGHPTLGTSYLIRNVIEKSDVRSLSLNLGVGPIQVTFGDDGVLWMKQNEPVFGETLDPAQVASELSLSRDQIDSGYPCQRVSTGLEFLVVPLNSYEALKSARPPFGSELAHGYLLFCTGGYEPEQQIQARMFAASLGVPEDPATGSANGCLAAYLVEHEYFGRSTLDIRVGQGYEVARPSQLYLRSEKLPGDFRVAVGGRVGLLADGRWLI